jgi:hypothetical protein
MMYDIQVGTFDETRKELTQDIKQIISKTRLTLNETNLNKAQSSTSFLAHIDSIENDNDSLDEWLRLTSDEMRLLGKNIEKDFPLFIDFSYRSY